jgi:predicted enzyme related to lactoylglutathione lyase
VKSLAPGDSPHWSVFWQSDDVDASVATVSALGGTVLTEAADQGLGRVARVADPTGAPFWLLRPKGQHMAAAQASEANHEMRRQ